MEWVLLGIAAFMAIINLGAYARHRQSGYLLRGMAWVGFTAYLALRQPWLLYLSIGIFAIGLFIRPKPRASAYNAERAPEEPLPHVPADDAGAGEEIEGKP